MEILFSKSFIKQYKRLSRGLQEKLRERVRMFKKDPRNPLLRIHKLHGRRKPLMSMNVTGDYRVLFVWKDKKTVIFYEIGIHSQLY